MFFDESVFFVFALISPVVMYFYCHVMFFLTIIHLHVTFTFTHLLDYSRHLTFVMHQMLQRGWYYTIMHPPLNYLLTHTRIDTGVLLGYTHATGVLLVYTHPRTGYIRG